MARADLLCDLIKYGLCNDIVNFRKATEALCAEERAKQHTVLAKKIEELLNNAQNSRVRNGFLNNNLIKSTSTEASFISEKIPEKRLDCLILPDNVRLICQELIKEQNRSDLLQSYGIEPRNKLLLVGPPGNGKTSLAEAIAESLMLPLLTVRYENIIGAYLGETATRLSKLFEYAKTRQCVLFFDEFETLGKERGDVHETGEVKRVVSSLLMQIDDLPSHVIAIAATNHETLLDKAAWRRFQIKVDMPMPNEANLEEFYELFKKRRDFDFGVSASILAKKTVGISYAEAEEFAFSIYRQYILNLPNRNIKKITSEMMRSWKSQLLSVEDKYQGGE